LQFFSVNVSGRDLHMHMRVVGVSVDGGEHPRFRETLTQMPVDQLLRFFVVNFPIKRIDGPVMGSRFAPSSVRLRQFILFELPGEFSQVRHPLLVADFFLAGAIYIFGYILRPDSFFLPFGRPLAADVARMIGGAS
jgi:hypothetical protein